MHPFLRHCDVLTVESARAADLRIGDVAFFLRSQQQTVAHRVVGIDQDRNQVSLRTMGDAEWGPTEIATSEQVLGRVVKIERNGQSIPLDQGFPNRASRMGHRFRILLRATRWLFRMLKRAVQPLLVWLHTRH